MIEVKSPQLANIERSIILSRYGPKKIPPKLISCQLSKIFGPSVKKNCLILHLASEDGMVQTSIFQLKIIVKTVLYLKQFVKLESFQVS